MTIFQYEVEECIDARHAGTDIEGIYVPSSSVVLALLASADTDDLSALASLADKADGALAPFILALIIAIKGRDALRKKQNRDRQTKGEGLLPPVAGQWFVDAPTNELVCSDHWHFFEFGSEALAEFVRGRKGPR